MSFKRRNVAIAPIGGPRATSLSNAPSNTIVARRPTDLAPGVRPSAVDGRLTTSTGTSSLDATLAGHAGLPLGHSLLLQESTTTDFGGVVLRYFAAEGLVLGHHIHVIGVPESWKSTLPGLVAKQNSNPSQVAKSRDSRMKIAWRYESLGNQQRANSDTGNSKDNSTFCHKFDLNNRLDNASIKGIFSVYPVLPTESLVSLIAAIEAKIMSSPNGTIHRIIVPNLLLPTIYPLTMCRPSEVLQCLHALRALLRRCPEQTAAILTISADMFPSTTGLGKWIESLNDGVAHMVPTPSQIANTDESTENIQGHFRIARLPVYNEKGGGLGEGNFGESLSFKLSGSSGLTILPLALPPTLEMESLESNKSKNEEKMRLSF